MCRYTVHFTCMPTEERIGMHKPYDYTNEDA
jgi:hypothetical protein